MFCETTALVYLGLCQILVPSGSNLPSTCNMNAKQNLVAFLFWVLWPIVSVRYIGYFALRNTNYETLKKLTLMLGIQYNLSYGIWTYINLSRIVQMQANSPTRCTMSANMMDLNYDMVVIFGMFPALTLTSIVVLALLCSPCIIIAIIRNRRDALR